MKYKINYSLIGSGKNTTDHQKFNINSTEYHNFFKIMLEELQDFHIYAKENNITYSLRGGSAISYFTINSYFPWDDDIDLSIKYSDREKILKLWDSRKKIASFDPWSRSTVEGGEVLINGKKYYIVQYFGETYDFLKLIKYKPYEQLKKQKAYGGLDLFIVKLDEKKKQFYPFSFNESPKEIKFAGINTMIDESLEHYNYLVNFYGEIESWGLYPELFTEEQKNLKSKNIDILKKNLSLIGGNLVINQIAHAGGIHPNNCTQTNSPDALIYNYNQGFRYFEFDVGANEIKRNISENKIIDNKLYVWHYNDCTKDINPYKYLFSDIFDIFLGYDDMYLIIDNYNKQLYNDVLLAIIKLIQSKKVNDSFLDRIIIQVGNTDQINDLLKINEDFKYFRNILIAFWYFKPTIQDIKNIINKANNLNIFGCSIDHKSSHLYNDHIQYLNKKNLKVYFHNINYNEAKKLLKDNYGIFSDFEFIK